MEPFTLEWWMNLLDKNLGGIMSMQKIIAQDPIRMMQRKSYSFYEKKLELHEWIVQRIINKYGE